MRQREMLVQRAHLNRLWEALRRHFLLLGCWELPCWLGPVLPLATAYAICETFGLPKGVNLDFRRARVFFNLFTGLIVIGAGVALIPNLPLIKMLLWIQVLNDVLLPIILVFILLLINDGRLVGHLKNTRFYNVLGWGTFAMITVALGVMLTGQVLDLFGIQLFGGG